MMVGVILVKADSSTLNIALAGEILALTKDDLLRRIEERKVVNERLSGKPVIVFDELVNIIADWNGRTSKMFTFLSTPDAGGFLLSDPIPDGFDGSKESCAEITRKANEK